MIVELQIYNEILQSVHIYTTPCTLLLPAVHQEFPGQLGGRRALNGQAQLRHADDPERQLQASSCPDPCGQASAGHRVLPSVRIAQRAPQAATARIASRHVSTWPRPGTIRPLHRCHGIMSAAAGTTARTSSSWTMCSTATECTKRWCAAAATTTGRNRAGLCRGGPSPCTQAGQRHDSMRVAGLLVGSPR